MVPYGSYDHFVHRLSHNSNDFLGNPSHFVFADCDTGRDLSVQETVSTPILPNIFPTVLYWSWIEGKKWTLGVESISECGASECPRDIAWLHSHSNQSGRKWQKLPLHKPDRLRRLKHWEENPPTEPYHRHKGFAWRPSGHIRDF